ncbi:unnamed protein product [Phytophthora fragariaefolia]|uniref:Unnamed protein product n=1 Tax=Phytophthora fragariaefolia TaxID=1490495 RepID=A0A9W6Y0F0_9STRA|nr:unnamed protein product [Phytophthora fragariaefolia]
MTTLNVEHHIDTGTAAPILQKRRRHAQAEDAIIESNVIQLLQAGVIEESDQERFLSTAPIDDTLEALGGAQLFITLDLRSGYWQIGVAPAGRDKTAFTTNQGLYRFRRMPFGLMNASSTFQRMMNGVLRGLMWLTCLVYLDNIVVYTKGSIERHILELPTLPERLRAADLTLRLKKCVFATKTMEYLGYELSSVGVRPVGRLVTAVSKFPRPKDVVKVKRFVRLAEYYRKFIEPFGSMMRPMTRLLKKDVEWE